MVEGLVRIRTGKFRLWNQGGWRKDDKLEVSEEYTCASSWRKFAVYHENVNVDFALRR